MDQTWWILAPFAIAAIVCVPLILIGMWLDKT